MQRLLERPDRALVLVAASLAAPVLVATAAAVAGDPSWRPVGDLAIMELVTRDVGHEPVLVGAYSRFGWHHPGPALFHLLAPLYLLSGGSSGSLVVSAALVNGASIAAVVAVARRRVGAPGALWAAVVVLALLASLGSKVANPWNPTMAILPFLAYVVLLWAAATGDRWPAVGAVVAGSVAVQAHVGFALPAAALALGALGVALARRGGPTVAPPRVLAACAVALAALWSPVVVEQLQGHGGNLGRLAAYAREAEPSWGPAQSAELAVVRFGAPLADLLGVEARPDPHLRDGRSLVPGALTLVALGSALAVGLRRGRRAEVVLALAGLVLLVTGAMTVGRIEGRVAEWLVEWLSLGGAVAWLALGWALLGDREGSEGHAAGVPAGLAAGVLVLAAATTAAALADRPLGAETSAAMAELGGEVAADLRATGEEAVEVTFGPSAERGPSAVGWGSGLVLALEKAGFRTAVDPRWRYQFGDRRTEGWDGGTSRPQLRVVTGDSDDDVGVEGRLVASARTDHVEVRVLRTEVTGP